MTDEQRAYWQGYVDTLKPIMRLCDWRITVELDAPHEGAEASAWTSNDYKTARIYVDAEWTDKTPDDQRETIAHELVHVHLSRLSMFTEKIAGQLGGQAEGMANEMAEHFLEAATEDLARVIAPFLPLPPKAKKERG